MESKGVTGEEALAVTEFASNELFKSATVDELDLRGDFLRRPVRPEDLRTMSWPATLSGEAACDLQSLATHRLLRCIHDQETVRFPGENDDGEWRRFELFYGAGTRLAAARARPVLERTAFSYLDRSRTLEADAHECRRTVERLAHESMAFIESCTQMMSEGLLNESGMRLLVAQVGGLLPCKQAAIRHARDKRPSWGGLDWGCAAPWPTSHDEIVMAAAGDLDVEVRPHSQWQFYLPSTLAEANWLDTLALEPERSFEFLGAVLAESISRKALGEVVFAWASGRKLSTPPPTAGWLAPLIDHLANTLAHIVHVAGQRGMSDFHAGLELGAQLAANVRRDVSAQLDWLGRLSDYAACARLLARRIDVEAPDIKRETFVEPREMCSTTHVHDDHRLVVIESGRMVFWAAPHMCLEFAPGEMMYVPRGRLHGSSVLTQECVYHQPIIPEAWVHASMPRKASGGLTVDEVAHV